MRFKNLIAFSLKPIAKRLNSINITINLQHQEPFPKPKKRMLSWYTYQNRWVKILPNGYFNKARLVTSLIDFTFIRSLVADAYSKEGAHCYDPVSLFLCDIFRWIEGFRFMKDFCRRLHHKYNGDSYRLYAGISDNRIPCEADFSNFRVRIGEARYNAIFHILVEILQKLDIITARIISHDGTLVPTFARYRGCNYACEDCAHIQVGGDFISRVRNRILDLLKNPSQLNPIKSYRVFAKCLKGTLPNDVKPPSIRVCEFKLLPFNPDTFDEKDQTAKLFGLEEALAKANLMLVPVRSNISKIDLNLEDNPVFVRCPRMPKDLDARIGCRRSKLNPNKIEKIFGFHVIISTTIEPEIGIELPIACITQPGSAKDGHYFPDLKEQIKWQHPTLKTYVDIGDCGFDQTDNYNWCRAEGSIPIIDYNVRNENLSQQALLKRGYDQNGYPFAPCQATCKPNGFDKENKRLSFVCDKQCLSACNAQAGLKSPQTVPQPIPDCPHLNKSRGFTIHMSLKKNPRLTCEIPRGSKRWKKIRKLRPASERTNSTAKSDLNILDHPRTMGLERTAILGQMACIAVLLKRFVNFIVRITLTLRKAKITGAKKLWKILQLQKVPDYLTTIIQRE